MIRIGLLIAVVCVVIILATQPFEKQTIQPKLKDLIQEQELRDLLPDITITYGGRNLNSKEKPYRFVEFVFRKFAHIGLYAVLAITSYVAIALVQRSKLKRWASVLGFVLLVAILDETIQHFHASRSGRVDDVLLDMFGGLLGLLIAQSVDTIRNYLGLTN